MSNGPSDGIASRGGGDPMATRPNTTYFGGLGPQQFPSSGEDMLNILFPASFIPLGVDPAYSLTTILYIYHILFYSTLCHIRLQYPFLSFPWKVSVALPAPKSHSYNCAFHLIIFLLIAQVHWQDRAQGLLKRRNFSVSKDSVLKCSLLYSPHTSHAGLQC